PTTLKPTVISNASALPFSGMERGRVGRDEHHAGSSGSTRPIPGAPADAASAMLRGVAAPRRLSMTMLAFVVGCTGARAPDDDVGAIRAALEAWPRAWSARDLPAVCDLFAPNVVLSFPGSHDRDHAAMCDGFGALFARTDRVIRYDEPDVQE